MRPPGLFVGAAFSIKFGYSERGKKERGCGPTERKMSWCGFVFLGTSLWSVCVIEQFREHFEAVRTKGFSGLQYVQTHSGSTQTLPLFSA